MLESYPLASQYAADWIVLLEGDQDSAHGNVTEDDRQRQRREQEEYVQLPVLDNVDKRVVQSGIFVVCSDGFCFAHRFLLSDLDLFKFVLVLKFYFQFCYRQLLFFHLCICKNRDLTSVNTDYHIFLHLVNSIFTIMLKLF